MRQPMEQWQLPVLGMCPSCCYLSSLILVGKKIKKSIFLDSETKTNFQRNFWCWPHDGCQWSKDEGRLGEVSCCVEVQEGRLRGRGDGRGTRWQMVTVAGDTSDLGKQGTARVMRHGQMQGGRMDLGACRIHGQKMEWLESPKARDSSVAEVEHRHRRIRSQISHPVPQEELWERQNGRVSY